MRLYTTIVAATIVLSLSMADKVQAQLICYLGYPQQQYIPSKDQLPSQRAEQELALIYKALCPPPYVCGMYQLRSNTTVGNARAELIGPGQTKISYNPAVFDSLALKYGGGATFGILAHEFGHHIDLHQTPPWLNTSWSRELKADAWAGCALARTQVSSVYLENALVAISKFPTPSHPSWQLRVQAVRVGFVNCGGGLHLWPN